MASCPVLDASREGAPAPAQMWARFAASKGWSAARLCRDFVRRSPLGIRRELPGPVGESNVYSLHPKGRALCFASSTEELAVQIGAALATGNIAVVLKSSASRAIDDVAAEYGGAIELVSGGDLPNGDVALFEGSDDELRVVSRALARRAGPIVPLYRRGPTGYPLEFLVSERTVSHNTAAAGGNASLMSI
jgi:RHH-type transcriptional regulator, proline utilization regulon repressor / proline dehydrogenase / delta 1-pyrroline-5-carboxylate dehydrogenase